MGTTKEKEAGQGPQLDLHCSYGTHLCRRYVDMDFALDYDMAGGLQDCKSLQSGATAEHKMARA